MIEITREQAKNAFFMLKWMRSSAALKISNTLRERKCVVADLQIILSCSQPEASQQLARLRRFGLVERKKEGKFVQYSLAEKFDSVNEDAFNFKEDTGVSLKEALHLLGDDVTYDILTYVQNNSNTTVAPIYGNLKIEQAVCSKFLGFLRAKQLVLATRKGKYVHYTINASLLEKISKITEKILLNNGSDNISE